jgi:hypothetical protein
VAPLAVHALPALNKVGVERLLAAVQPGSYFIDVSRLPTDDTTAGWLTPQSSRMEGRWTQSTVLAKDFDGALYVPEVTPGTGMVPDGPFKVLQVFGLAADHSMMAATGTAAIILWLTVLVMRRISGRRTISSEPSGV